MPDIRAVPPIPAEIASHALKLKAAELLGLGIKANRSWQEVADEIEISVRQLYEWRQDPKFQEAVFVFMQEALRDSMPGVFNTMQGILSNGEPRDKLRAGEILLKAGGMLIDRVSVDHRGEARAMLDALDHELEGIKREAIEGEVEDAEYEEVHSAE